MDHYMDIYCYSKKVVLINYHYPAQPIELMEDNTTYRTDRSLLGRQTSIWSFSA